MTRTDFAFTQNTWRYLLQHLRAFVLAPTTGPAARSLLAVVLLLVLTGNALNVVNSYVGRNVMTAVAGREELQFLLHAGLWVGVFAAATVATVLCKYGEDRLALGWREWATRQLIDRYMANQSYLRATTEAGSDNADQRIAEDVKSFTAMTLSFLLMIFNATLTVVAFSAVLWSISPLLFGVGVVYALFGSLLSLRLGHPLVALNSRQLDREADFRATLVHIKDDAPLVALTAREDTFTRHLRRHLVALVENGGNVIKGQRKLGFFTTGYNWLLQIIPLVIVAPLFMRGEVEFGVITQSAIAFTHLLGAFSLIVTQMPVLSSLAAVATRLETLEAAFDEQPAREPVIEIIEDDTRIVFEAVTLCSAHPRRALLTALALEVKPGERWLVSGSEHVVRAALMQTVAGLRRWGSGRLHRPTSRQIMYLPEQPFLPDGTLAELLYTGPAAESGPRPSRDSILSVLGALGLEAALSTCVGADVEQQWTTRLNGSEQQLLACARVLLARPKFVMLERPGVRLEQATIEQVLDCFTRAGITYVVLDASNEFPQAFDRELQLHADGTWRLLARGDWAIEP